jgi:hypothetical protein
MRGFLCPMCHMNISFYATLPSYKAKQIPHVHNVHFQNVENWLGRRHSGYTLGDPVIIFRGADTAEKHILINDNLQYMENRMLYGSAINVAR